MECKLDYFTTKLNEYNGFILTIWNVNHQIKLCLIIVLLGFILTIWNVNHTKYCYGDKHSDQFYINYMECK